MSTKLSAQYQPDFVLISNPNATQKVRLNYNRSGFIGMCTIRKKRLSTTNQTRHWKVRVTSVSAIDGSKRCEKAFSLVLAAAQRGISNDPQGNS